LCIIYPLQKNSVWKFCLKDAIYDVLSFYSSWISDGIDFRKNHCFAYCISKTKQRIIPIYLARFFTISARGLVTVLFSERIIVLHILFQRLNKESFLSTLQIFSMYYHSPPLLEVIQVMVTRWICVLFWTFSGCNHVCEYKYPRDLVSHQKSYLDCIYCLEVETWSYVWNLSLKAYLDCIYCLEVETWIYVWNVSLLHIGLRLYASILNFIFTTFIFNQVCSSFVLNMLLFSFEIL